MKVAFEQLTDSLNPVLIDKWMNQEHVAMEKRKCGHESIHRSPGSVPVSHLDYFCLTQICGNTCPQVPELKGQVPAMIQVPMSI
jgi:hypothetical protein